MANTYHIAVSGELASRKAILGSLILSDTYRITTVKHCHGHESVAFRFRGDARLALKKVARDLIGSRPQSCDSLLFEGAEARIEKIAS